MQELPPKFESWCIVLVLGHNRFAGFVTDRVMALGMLEAAKDMILKAGDD